MAKVWIPPYQKKDGTLVKGHYRDVSINEKGLVGKEKEANKQWQKAYKRDEAAFDTDAPKSVQRAASKNLRKMTKKLKTVTRLGTKRMDARGSLGLISKVRKSRSIFG